MQDEITKLKKENFRLLNFPPLPSAPKKVGLKSLHVLLLLFPIILESFPKIFGISKQRSSRQRRDANYSVWQYLQTDTNIKGQLLIWMWY